MPRGRKPAAPKPLSAKQEAKVDALIAKLGISGDVVDLSLLKIAAKQADERARNYKKLLAILTPKRKARKPAEAKA